MAPRWFVLRQRRPRRQQIEAGGHLQPIRDPHNARGFVAGQAEVLQPQPELRSPLFDRKIARDVVRVRSSGNAKSKASGNSRWSQPSVGVGSSVAPEMQLSEKELAGLIVVND
jgi:hypothetical protein